LCRSVLAIVLGGRQVRLRAEEILLDTFRRFASINQPESGAMSIPSAP